MSVKQYTAGNIFSSSWVNNNQHKTRKTVGKFFNLKTVDFLRPLRNWLDNLEIHNPLVAHKICEAIPTQCPFARDIKVLGRTLFSIPPLCKLNPLYDEIVALRFRALCYLADECGEDVSSYC